MRLSNPNHQHGEFSRFGELFFTLKKAIEISLGAVSFLLYFFLHAKLIQANVH